MTKNPRPTTTPAEPRAFATWEQLSAAMGEKVTRPPVRTR